MSPLEIEVGRTYTNRGAGKTHRTVIAIGNEHRPERFLSSNEPPNEPGVLYEQNGKRSNLYLSSFAQWCGKDVTTNTLSHRPSEPEASEGSVG